jgi:hypothetical protein
MVNAVAPAQSEQSRSKTQRPVLRRCLRVSRALS